MNWRPPNWGKDPCYGCKNRDEDRWGFVCDISCGRHSAHMNFEAGADAILKALWKLAEESPTKTFTLDANVVSIYREE